LANSRNNIGKLRMLFKTNNIDGYLLPHEDELLSEYLPKYAERLSWLTGFSGSAGLSFISLKKAIIFVDGRYTTQVRKETNPKIFEYEHLIDPGFVKWIKKNPFKNRRIGFDPKTVSQSNYQRIEKACKQSNIEFIETKNLLDLIWKRQKKHKNPIFMHELKYSGIESSTKKRKILKSIANEGADSLLVSQSENVCWILNIRGQDLEHTPILRSHLIIDKNSKVALFTDNKTIDKKIIYWIGDDVEVYKIREIEAYLKKMKFKKTQYDPDHTSLYHSKLIRGLSLSYKEGKDPTTLMKACKNNVEIKGMHEAHLNDGVALTKFLFWLEKNTKKMKIDELTAQRKLLEFRKRNKDLKSLSFNTISGTGSNGAIIHYKSNQKTNKVLKPGDLFLLDSGGQYKYGTTDVTRTLGINKNISDISEEKINNFTLVLKGHIAVATNHFKYGETGIKLDTLARKFLKKEGLNFDHGTGHGVGSYLGVHEGPQSISPRSTVPLEKGMIISNEPGYYKEGAYGIRIENLVVVTNSRKKDVDLCFETLTLAPLDKNLINKHLLNNQETSWLNSYHKKVYKKLSPFMNKQEKEWLRNSTLPL